MFAWFKRTSRRDLLNELEKLRKREAIYGPVAKLQDRLDRMCEEYSRLCDQYEAKQEVIRAYGPLEKLHQSKLGVENSIATLNRDYKAKKEHYDRLAILTGRMEDHAYWQDIGIYQPVFSHDSSIAYQNQLRHNLDQQKAMIKSKAAATCEITWTVNGSAREGKAMIKEGVKLALRAFNNECEAIIGRVTWRNYEASRVRIDRAFEQINRLKATNQIAISSAYLELKLQQLRLTHEQAQKVKEERDEAYRIRELERENARAQREYEQEIQKREEEEERYQQALNRAREELGYNDSAQLRKTIGELEAKLERAMAERERAVSMAQLTRSGYVYIISNVGSFGEKVFKIGMTRRIDPMDRIYELGNASVPFAFDVHAMIWSADAPGLERMLHKRLDEHRVNRVNFRKEFFSANMDAVRSALHACVPGAPFTEQADAEQYYLSIATRRAPESEPLPGALEPMTQAA